ncbi:hypothetical protein [Photorhabdus stackebrandtii]|uniref:Uncharacterized protein n=1 Tax=Photorhabdus stackebrandtii TaxID=1123042 RepID=A0A7X5QQW6_9GAMM|nr:hypothetical protein [Photorhabdus stackebrandtii]NHB98682.1 hypothetical protein [Photorhabdus stackebrandtii]
MGRNWLLKTALACFFIFPTLAHASNCERRGQNLTGYLVEVGPTWGGERRVQVKIQEVNSTAAHILHIDHLDKPHVQLIYSGLLTAYSTGSKITLYCVGKGEFSSILLQAD